MAFKTRFTRWLRPYRAPAPPSPRPALEMLEDRRLPAVNINQTFVALLYQGDFHRSADGAGLSYWSAQLSAGASFTTVAAQILTSSEAHANDVQTDFATLLGRSPDAAGKQFWLTDLQDGATLELVASGIAASDEFFRKAGGTNVGYVKALFADLLGRSADSTGETVYNAELQQGASRALIAEQIIGSQEAANDLVNRDYQRELGRPADTAAINYWTPQMRTLDVRDEDLSAGIAGSTESVTAIGNDLATVNIADPNAAAQAIIQRTGRYPGAVNTPAGGTFAQLSSQTQQATNPLIIFLQPAPGPLVIHATTTSGNATGQLTIFNNGTTDLNYQAFGTLVGPNNQPLALRFDHATGTVAAGLSMIVNVGVNATGLPVGTYIGNVIVTDTSGAASLATEPVQVSVIVNNATIVGTYTGSYTGSASSQGSAMGVSGALTLTITGTTLLPNSSTVYTISGSAEADNFFGQNVAVPLLSVLSTFSPTNSIGAGTKANGIFADAATDIISARYIELATGNVSVANGKYTLSGTVAINDGKNDWLGADALGTYTLTQN